MEQRKKGRPYKTFKYVSIISGLPISVYDWRKEQRGFKNKKWAEDKNKQLIDKDLIRYERDIKEKYGLSIQDKIVLYQKQFNKCAICDKSFNFNELVIDHNHNKNKVRGLLCRHCNIGIGFLREDKTVLNSAIKYLELHNTII